MATDVRFVQYRSTRGVTTGRRLFSVSLPSRGRGNGAAVQRLIANDGGGGDGGGGKNKKARFRGGVVRGTWLRFVLMLQSLFLPEGFPSSVTPDYLAFQAWDTAQAMCSYLRGILATQAILDGVGVGDGTKTVASATLQWVTRDGASMLGGLLFTWWGGTNFDKSVKFLSLIHI